MPTPFSPLQNISFSDTYNFLRAFKIHTSFLRIPPSAPVPFHTGFFCHLSSLSDFSTLISLLPRFLYSDFFTFPSPPDFSLSAAVISTSPPFPFTLVLHSLSLSFFLTFSFYTSTPISSSFLTFSRFNFSCSLLFYNRNFLILFLPSIFSPSLPFSPPQLPHAFSSLSLFTSSSFSTL